MCFVELSEKRRSQPSYNTRNNSTGVHLYCTKRRMSIRIIEILIGMPQEAQPPKGPFHFVGIGALMDREDGVKTDLESYRHEPELSCHIHPRGEGGKEIAKRILRETQLVPSGILGPANSGVAKNLLASLSRGRLRGYTSPTSRFLSTL